MVSEWIYLCEALCDCKNLSFPFVWIFATPWTVAQQAPLSMGFPRQEYWSGGPRSPPWVFPHPGIKPASLMSPALAVGCFTAATQWVSESHSVVSNSLQSYGLYSPWNFPGQNTEVGSLSLLQRIFPTQEGLNPSVPHGWRILYQLGYKESPRILEWVVYPLLQGIFPTQESNPGLLHCK